MNDRRSSRLLLQLAWIAGAVLAPFGGAVPQSVVAYKAAVVALTDDTALRAEFERAVLMLRPAAIGAGSSLESVRGEVSPATFASMRAFSRRVSSSGATDLIAVAHMAAYAVTDEGAELISSGAVWLDEPVTDRAEAVARLQDLVVANVDAARGAIRRRLGLPSV